MADEITYTEDEPPRSGEWIDPEETPLTDEEQRLGSELGKRIDIEDDGDNGL